MLVYQRVCSGMNIQKRYGSYASIQPTWQNGSYREPGSSLYTVEASPIVCDGISYVKSDGQYGKTRIFSARNIVRLMVIWFDKTRIQ